MAGIGQTGKAAFRLCTAVHELNHLCGHKEEFPQGKSTGKPEQKKTRSSLSDAQFLHCVPEREHFQPDAQGRTTL